MLKLGYKQTDLGVLPEEWEVAKLGKHVTFRTGPFGSALHKSDYVEGGIPIVNPMQIIDGGIVPTESMAISEEAAIQLSEFLLSSGEIVIGRRGEMGRCAVVKQKNHGWLCGTGSMIIRASQSVDARFLQRVLSSQPIIEAIENASVGTTMVNLNQSLLSNLQIPLPPFVEQHSIADSLDALDNLLTSQQQLLAKKCALKLATQQALLSGERRLPGFAGEWEEKTLGEVVKIRKGTLITEKTRVAGSIPVVAGGQTPAYYHSTANRFGKTITISASGAYAGYVAFYEQPIFASDCSTIEAGSAYDLRFIYFFLKSRQAEIYGSQTGGAQPHIHAKDLEPMSIPLPPLAEQRAIAAILSDMDSEIEALAAQVAKTQALKQGMMQDLLTGTIRLTAGAAAPSSHTPNERESRTSRARHAGPRGRVISVGAGLRLPG